MRLIVFDRWEISIAYDFLSTFFSGIGSIFFVLEKSRNHKHISWENFAKIRFPAETKQTFNKLTVWINPINPEDDYATSLRLSIKDNILNSSLVLIYGQLLIFNHSSWA